MHRVAGGVQPRLAVAVIDLDHFQDVLPGTLAPLAERLREAVAGVPVDTEVSPITATISRGGASMRTDEALEGAMRRADQALYRAKREGRNRVVFADPTQSD